MLVRIAVNVTVNGLVLLVLAMLFPAWITFDDPGTAFMAALVLVLLNAFIRPVLFMLTLPATIFTFGFFALVINGLMMTLAALWIEGFDLSGFWAAILVALIFSLISSFIFKVLDRE